MQGLSVHHYHSQTWKGHTFPHEMKQLFSVFSGWLDWTLSEGISFERPLAASTGTWQWNLNCKIKNPSPLGHATNTALLLLLSWLVQFILKYPFFTSDTIPIWPSRFSFWPTYFREAPTLRSSQLRRYLSLRHRDFPESQFSHHSDSVSEAKKGRAWDISHLRIDHLISDSLVARWEELEL